MDVWEEYQRGEVTVADESLDFWLCRALQASQHELERQRITDNLKKNLAQRPEKEQLVERKLSSASSFSISSCLANLHVNPLFPLDLRDS